jgi:hypothetical protein
VRRQPGWKVWPGDHRLIGENIVHPIPVAGSLDRPKAVAGLGFYAELVLIGLITYIIHECAHWLAGAAMGAEMKASLNGVRYLTALTPGQRAIADMSGPLATILQGICAYLLVRRTQSLRAFGCLYLAAFMRIVAGLISFTFLNDEARFSTYLDLPAWVVPVAVGGFLLAMLVAASRELRLGWKAQLGCYLVASVTVTLIVGVDMLAKR